MTFEEWMQKIDKLYQRKLGVSVHDMPDEPWRDFYEDGITPEEIMELAVEGAF